ncbi:hypothetical protein RSAG8_01988, partial [Rhizoctonia solani AG-8 WAC10335]
MALTRSVAMDLGLSQSTLGVGTGSGKSASASDIVALGKARTVVDAHLAKHASRIPPLDETINASASTDYTLVPNEAWEQFYMRKAASLPDGLFEHIESAHNHSAMGLLPEINYAWIVLGNMLLLWDYANPSSELVRYDQQPNLITHVGLDRHRPGIFVDTIQQLLVLCTPLAVQIIGVEITPSEMKLYETDISISTDGVEMTSVVSSKLGRIFMLGIQDGCLYELTYQAAESWFTKKPALVNHSTSGYASFIPSITSLIMPKLDQRLLVLVSDPDRKCLYALTDRNHIIMYYLGQPEDSLRMVVDAKDLRGAAQSLCPSVALNSASFRICSLIVLPPSEASFAVLIAITTGGARLYFSHQRRGYGSYGAPSTLALIHVRPPPAQLPHPEQPYQNPLFGRDHLQGLPSAARFCNEASARPIHYIQPHDLSPPRSSHPQLLLVGSGEFTAARGGAEQEAFKTEHTSIAQLQALLSRVIEGISFVLLLIDYKFSETVALCESSLQQSLSKLTFDGLMTTTEGAEIARGLINNVINQQISQQISVDAISETLQQRCGSFCSAADVLLYKALESVRKAKETRDANEQRTCLKESFRLFPTCTSTLSLEKLQEVVSEYRTLRYANGAVQLPLQCAKDWDADNHGRDYWPSERSSGDERREAYKLRRECYKLVTETLSVFDVAYEQSQGKEDGGAGDAEAVRKNAYQLALGSDDPMFHAELYDWLVSQGRTDDLLEIRTPYIEDHLIQQAQRNDKWGELLWQFFVHSGQYLRAAYALQALADSETDLDLETRIEYLSLAVSNAKSHPSSEYGQHETAVEFLSDLEDKLEVAQVQLEIANLLSRKNATESDPEWRRRYEVLTARLLDLSTLYREFAEPEGLNAMKLLILKVADRRDPQLVTSIWEAILMEAGTPQAVQEQVSTLAMRFFPSEIAFPLDLVCKLLDEFAWPRRLPPTWVPSVLLSGGIPFDAIFGALLAIHESSVPPYNDIARTNHVLAEITVLLETWLDEQTRPGVGSTRAEFPVNYLDEVVSEFILHARATEQQNETTTRLLDIQRRLRRRF